MTVRPTPDHSRSPRDQPAPAAGRRRRLISRVARVLGDLFLIAIGVASFGVGAYLAMEGQDTTSLLGGLAWCGIGICALLAAFRW